MCLRLIEVVNSPLAARGPWAELDLPESRRRGQDRAVLLDLSLAVGDPNKACLVTFSTSSGASVIDHKKYDELIYWMWRKSSS